jgi:hypothetical protein
MYFGGLMHLLLFIVFHTHTSYLMLYEKLLSGMCCFEFHDLRGRNGGPGELIAILPLANAHSNRDRLTIKVYVPVAIPYT